MENNFESGITNLQGNIGQPVIHSIDDNIQAVNITAQTVQVNDIKTTVSQDTIDAINSSNTNKNDVIKESINTDKFIVDTEELKRAYNIISEAYNGDANTNFVSIAIFNFTSEGLELLGTNKNTYAQYTLKTYKYNNSLKFNMDCVKFPLLLSKLTTKTIEFMLNNEDKSVKIIADGEYVFPMPADFDDVEGLQSIKIDDKFLNVEMRKYEALDFQKYLRMANVFSVPRQVDFRFNGVYNTDCLYSSTVGNVAYIHENVPTLKDVRVFYADSFMNIMNKLDLSKGDHYIGFYTDPALNYITHTIIKGDNYIIVCSNRDQEAFNQFPINSFERLAKTEFDQVTSFNKNDLIPTLERVQLFIDLSSKDTGELEFTCDNNLNVRSISGTAHEVVALKNYNFGQKKFKLRSSDLLDVLKNLKTDEVLLKFNSTNASIICLSDNESTMLLSVFE